MKKLLSVSLLASTLLFGAETYTEFLNTALQDANELHNYSKAKIEKLAQSDSELQTYTKKLADYEAKLATFIESQTQEKFSSKEDAQKALNEIEMLSSQSVVLGKSIANLASNQADSASKNYNATIQTASKTILRLSDDIGAMADRILLMAQEIGVMADRIVQTQEIQSRNLIATQKLARYAMTMTNQQVTTTKDTMQKMNTQQNNFHTAIPNMNNMQMNQAHTPQTMQQVSHQTTQMIIPMH